MDYEPYLETKRSPDRGISFDCEAFRDWCRDIILQWRHGAVGRHGSIAVIERYFRTLKTEPACPIIVPDE